MRERARTLWFGPVSFCSTHANGKAKLIQLIIRESSNAQQPHERSERDGVQEHRQKVDMARPHGVQVASVQHGQQRALSPAKQAPNCQGELGEEDHSDEP